MCRGHHFVKILSLFSHPWNQFSSNFFFKKINLMLNFTKFCYCILFINFQFLVKLWSKTIQPEQPNGEPYVQIVSDGKCLFPDRPRRKYLVSRFSYVHKIFVFWNPDVRALIDFCDLLIRLLCVHQTFALWCSVFLTFTRFSCLHQISYVHVEILVCSNSHIPEFIWFSHL